ncbi:MAG: ABC transporter substrate-binding protein [Leucobacter sp.]|nr:ABC transporter substrate-binding protein [Leucobacter sp.]
MRASRVWLSVGRGRAAVALAVALAAGLGLAGCQSAAPGAAGDPQATAVDLPPLDQLDPIADPTVWEGPSTAVIGGPSFTLDVEPMAPQLPVTVMSKDRGGDREVTVTDASRVLALSLTGTLAELVDAYGLAGLLVGRDVSTQLPDLVDLPVVTREGHSLDPESVLALEPTLILTDGSIGPVDVLLQLRDAGIPVVMVTRAIDAESTYETARQVASALGVAPLGEALVPQLTQAIAQKEAEVARLLPADPSKLPRVAFLYVRGTAGIYYLFGEGSGIDSIIRSIGALDAASEIGWKGEKPMTDEALVALDPDIIVVMTKGLESAGGVDGLLAAQPSIALTAAGAHRRIIDVDDALVFAGGTRIPDVIDGLARAVYAPDSL